MKNYKIFKYRKLNSHGVYGTKLCGFEIIIDNKSSSNLYYNALTLEGRCFDQKIYSLPDAVITKIIQVIEENSEIFDVNSVLRETSTEGTCHTFWFATPQKNREVRTWNIQGAIDDEYVNDYDFSEEYKKISIQEKLVLKVFLEISKILSKEGHFLELYKFTGNESKLV